MAENEKDQKTFKVEDRRTSSGKGKDEDGPPAPSPETIADQALKEEEKAAEQGKGGTKVDFSTFIFSLFSSALIQMGDMADPMTGQVDKNLQAAQQTIDIIDMMISKTKGNLTDEEEKLIKSASAELKWKYLDAVREGR
ncbi:MAG: DUF1844 domain-containing protein [Proteobacteria bacterium]|nr:DUF1844 domain-containing protein [Pseudomonadota bacterium]